ncbi:MAG TPA: alpha/beta hydrolase, partial [Myxococcota bacterium]|nr:alpha/beta hydrolase [Myxococcota bacterium]
AITAPVLFVRPTDGIPVDETLLATWVGDIGKLTRASPVGGHHVHLEYPDRVAPMVQDFLQGLPE